jgi:hypothetical protein
MGTVSNTVLGNTPLSPFFQARSLAVVPLEEVMRDEKHNQTESDEKSGCGFFCCLAIKTSSDIVI